MRTVPPPNEGQYGRTVRWSVWEREETEVITSAEVHGRPRLRDVVGAAVRTYRERFWRVAGTAFVVFGVVAAMDAFATVLVIDRHVSRPVGAAITSAASAVFAMVGVVVYAGILDKVVGAHLHVVTKSTWGD